MINDSELYYPYDNDPEPKKYTVMIEAKVYSWVDVEAIGTEDLKIEVDYLNNKEILNGVEEVELISAYINDADGTPLFNYSDEERLRRRVKQLEKELKEIKEFYGEKENKDGE